MSTLKVDTILKRTGTGTITVGQSGDTITIPSGATLNSAGTNTLNGIANTPLVQAGFSSASQAISSGSDTEIVYTVITKETPSGKFSTSTGRFTPGVVGFYYVSALARINGGNGAGEFANLQIRVNGSASTSGSAQGATYRRYQDDGAENSFAVDCIVELTSVTDYISVYIYQNQGSNQTLQADHTNFTAYRLLT
jgi:hypothetical protein